MKLKNNALLIVNKPEGYTSRDVVNIISKKFETKKVGHNGTLDPLATGVLVICLNRYTKLNNILSSDEKEYIATVKLGISTDTLDITGKIIKEDYKKINKKDLIQTLNKFNCTYEQEVPLYSAVKVNGKKLYEYARNGENVILPRKKVTIKSVELLSLNDKEFTFKCLVSKGTYIRSLIKDILVDLNTIGVMSDLKRVKQGMFSIENSYSLDDVLNDNYEFSYLKDVLNVPKINVDNCLLKMIQNGVPLRGNYPDRVLFMNDNEEIAVYVKENDTMKMEVLLKNID